MGFAFVAMACPSDPVDQPADGARFPSDFEERWVEAKDCRLSHEHELRHVRVLASPRALEPYEQLSSKFPFQPGDTLLKVEYDDADCTELLGYTVMFREEPGYAPENYDWRWQRVAPDRSLILDGPDGGDIETCITCHQVHCAHSGGFELICKDDTGGG